MPIAVAAAGMHDQSGRLVDDHDGIVLVHDDEGERLRLRIAMHRGSRWRNGNALATPQLALGLAMCTVDGHGAAVDPRTCRRLRECSGSMRASAWSRRRPASVAGTTRSRAGAGATAAWLAPERCGAFRLTGQRSFARTGAGRRL